MIQGVQDTYDTYPINHRFVRFVRVYSKLYTHIVNFNFKRNCLLCLPNCFRFLLENVKFSASVGKDVYLISINNEFINKQVLRY